MHIRRVFLLFLLIVATGLSSLSAQESDDWYYGKPIRDIKFKGLDNVSESDLRGITERFLGESFSDDLFADLINRLFAIDYFEDITPSAVPIDKDFQTVRIVVEVVEKPVVQKVRFLGALKIKSDSLKDALTGADFIVISILPGTFDEMQSDVHLPEEYGIYQSVGDTVGPGGVLRAMRTACPPRVLIPDSRFPETPGRRVTHSFRIGSVLPLQQPHLRTKALLFAKGYTYPHNTA